MSCKSALSLRKAILTAFLSILCGLVVSAQYNDSTHYRLFYSGTGMLNKTEAFSSYLLTNTMAFNVRHKKLDANLGSTWLFGEQGHRLTNNDLASQLDFNVRSRIKNLYYWGLGNFEKSYSLRVNNRVQSGLGLAYNILNRPDSVWLNVSDGIVYEHSELNAGDTMVNKYDTYRNSLRLRLRFRIRRYITFEGTGFLQQSLSEGADYIIRSNASVSVRMLKWVALTSALTYNKVNRNNRENLLLTFGVILEGWF